MTLLVVTTSFPHPCNKNSGIFVFNLVRELAKYYNVEVITPSCKGVVTFDQSLPFSVKYCRYYYASGEILAHLPGGVPAAFQRFRWLTVLPAVSMLLSMMFHLLTKVKRGDLILANWSVCGLISLPARLWGCKVVCVFRGEDITRAASSRLFSLVLRACVRFSDRIVLVSSDMMKDKCAVDSCEAKVVHINNGVSGELIALPLKRNNTKYRLLCVGSLIERKNVSYILKSLSLANFRFEWVLDVVGDGPLMSDLQREALDLELTDKVIFHGKVGHEELVDFYREASILVFASFSEGKPNVLIEAMAAGVPVVACKIAGVTELVQHGVTGILCQHSFPEQIGAAVDLLRNDRKYYEKLALNGRKLIEEEFGDWGCAAIRYRNLFNELMRS